MGSYGVCDSTRWRMSASGDGLMWSVEAVGTVRSMSITSRRERRAGADAVSDTVSAPW